MPLAIAIVIVLLAFAAIAYPLVRRTRRRAAPEVTTASDIQRILDSRDTLLRALRDLDYDKSLGNLSDNDYQLLRADYEQEAVEIYKALDARAGILPDAIEREVKRARKEIAERIEQGEAEKDRPTEAGKDVESRTWVDRPSPAPGQGS